MFDRIIRIACRLLGSSVVDRELQKRGVLTNPNSGVLRRCLFDEKRNFIGMHPDLRENVNKPYHILLRGLRNKISGDEHWFPANSSTHDEVKGILYPDMEDRHFDKMYMDGTGRVF